MHVVICAYVLRQDEVVNLRKEIVVHVNGDVGGLQRRSFECLYLGLEAVPRVLFTVRVADHSVFPDYDLREFPARAATYRYNERCRI